MQKLVDADARDEQIGVIYTYRNEAALPSRQSNYYGITPLKDIVLPHGWAEKKNISVADRLRFRSFVFSPFEPLIR